MKFLKHPRFPDKYRSKGFLRSLKIPLKFPWVRSLGLKMMVPTGFHSHRWLPQGLDILENLTLRPGLSLCSPNNGNP